MLNRRLYIFGLLWLSAIFTATGQTKTFDELKNYLHSVESFYRNYPQEHVYLHLDNTAYFKGECIWFKAYVLRDSPVAMTDLSRVLYVELVTPKGDIVEQLKLPVKEGQADGCITLKHAYTSGYYEVRAYTRYMTNWGTEAIFSRVVPVFNKPHKEGDYRHLSIAEWMDRLMPEDSIGGQQDEGLSVRFYPEGGHLISGLENRIAYEVTDSRGMPVDAEGYLMVDGHYIEDLHTIHEGRGIIKIKPSSAVACSQLFIRRQNNHDGSYSSFMLPEPETCGISMHVDVSDASNIRIVVQGTDSLVNSKLALLHTHRGSVLSFTPFPMRQGGYAFCLSRDDMNDGVNRLSIIDSNGHIYADRLVFAYPVSRTEHITVTSKDKTISPYQKVNIDISSSLRTPFSVSIRDAATDVVGSGGTNSQTWLLLSSELRGYVRNADYYLESNDATHRKATDLLMAVQGWRCYDKIGQSYQGKEKGQQPIEDGLYLNGQVKLRKGDRRKTKLRVVLFNQQGESLRGDTQTDDDGNYAFKLPNCEGEWTLLMEIQQNSKLVNRQVTVDRQFSPSRRWLWPAELEHHPVERNPRTGIPSEEEPTGETKNEESEFKHTRILSNVEIRGNRRGLLEGAEIWESERWGAWKSHTWYDVDRETDAIIDRGEQPPSFLSWLLGRNGSFEGTDDGMMARESKFMTSVNSTGGIPETDADGHLTDYNVKDNERIRPQDFIITSFNKGSATTYEQVEAEQKNRAALSDIHNTYRTYIENDGPTYNNRTIVWILNNNFYMVTGAPQSIKQTDIESILLDSQEEFPASMDEVKAVYITEDNLEWKHYVNIPKLEPFHPVTVYVYRHRSFPISHKGVRLTHFEGYTPPVAFTHADYSVMPHEADYRRTLYWNPNVVVNNDGQTTISFYNNSTCRQIAISAEGFNEKGQPVSYQLVE